MGQEISLTKPTDVFLGVIDIFAVLLPGLAATGLVLWDMGRLTAAPDTALLVALLIPGYLLGQIAYAAGSVLDSLVYDRLFKPRRAEADAPTPKWPQSHFRKNDQLYTRATDIALQAGNGPRVPAGSYQWAKMWLRTHSPEAAAELERVEAHSKLFRSLFIVVTAYALFHWREGITNGWLLAIGTLSPFLLLWRYCDVRQKAVQTCYLAFIQLNRKT